jgi:hypothetical protein
VYRICGGKTRQEVDDVPPYTGRSSLRVIESGIHPSPGEGAPQGRMRASEEAAFEEVETIFSTEFISPNLLPLGEE